MPRAAPPTKAGWMKSVAVSPTCTGTSGSTGVPHCMQYWAWSASVTLHCLHVFKRIPPGNPAQQTDQFANTLGDESPRRQPQQQARERAYDLHVDDHVRNHDLDPRQNNRES